MSKKEILGTSKTSLFRTLESLHSALKWPKYKQSPNLGVREKAERTHRVSFTKQKIKTLHTGKNDIIAL